jgi:hypothetical protein
MQKKNDSKKKKGQQQQQKYSDGIAMGQKKKVPKFNQREQWKGKGGGIVSRSRTSRNHPRRSRTRRILVTTPMSLGRVEPRQYRVTLWTFHAYLFRTGGARSGHVSLSVLNPRKRPFAKIAGRAFGTLCASGGGGGASMTTTRIVVVVVVAAALSGRIGSASCGSGRRGRGRGRGRGRESDKRLVVVVVVVVRVVAWCAVDVRERDREKCWGRRRGSLGDGSSPL